MKIPLEMSLRFVGSDYSFSPLTTTSMSFLGNRSGFGGGIYLFPQFSLILNSMRISEILKQAIFSGK